VHGNNAREALIKICLAASMAPGIAGVAAVK